MHLLFAAAEQACNTGDSSGLISGSSLPQTCADKGTIDNVYIIVFIVIGALTLLFFILGAVRYALSSGNPESIQKAKNQMQHALIGMVMAAMAAAIVNYVTGAL